MYKEISLLCLLLFPAVLVYLCRTQKVNPAHPTPIDTGKQAAVGKKKKDAKKKKNRQAQTMNKDPAATAPIEQSVPTKLREVEAPMPKTSMDTSASHSLASSSSQQAQILMGEEKPPARVMRIASQASSTVPVMPAEDGWNQVNVTPSRSKAGAATAPEPLTKKQRENMARAAKRKELKADQEVQQAARLRQHKKQLEEKRIDEFYSKGPGKHLVPKKIRPMAQNMMSRQEEQLIWDEKDG